LIATLQESSLLSILIIKNSSVRIDPMFEEKRSRSRRSQDAQVHVDLVRGTTETTQTTIRFEGSMWDFSSDGIRLHGKHNLTKGASLELVIEFEADQTKFHLAGNVKWVTETTEHEFIAGVELDQSSSPDITKWQEKFE